MYIALLKEIINDNWPMLTIFFVTMITIRIFYIINHKGKSSLYKELYNVLAVLYILLLFQIVTKSEANVGAGFNIMPFSEMTRYTFGSNLFMLNVIGNIIAFIPLGFFISTYVKPKRIISPFIISLIVSVSIELVQLGIARTFDVDDIILNVFGGLLGYLLYIGLKAIKRRLPKLLQKDGLYNIVCIIIIAIIILYVMKLAGVFG